MEDDERHYQPYSREYDWVGPDLTQNTRGRYILISLEFLITPVLLQSSSSPITVPDTVSYYPPLARRLLLYGCVLHDTFIELKSSAFVSYLWLNTMYIILNFIASYCYVTVPLKKNCVITKGLFYGCSLFLFSAIIEHDFISGC